MTMNVPSVPALLAEAAASEAEGEGEDIKRDDGSSSTCRGAATMPPSLPRPFV